MGDYGGAARPGFTRTGKSIKAVRRYYALKDSDRRRRSPQQSPEPKSPIKSIDRKSNETDDSNKYQQQSKRKRSPDDGLSKRIAAELKTQQEAIEMRSKRYPNRVDHIQTERSALPPIIVQPKDVGGPIFTTEPAYLTKSAKSTKSIGPSSPAKMDPTNNNYHNNDDSGDVSTGCIILIIFITSLLIGTIYLITWAVFKALEKDNIETQPIKGNFIGDFPFKS